MKNLILSSILVAIFCPGLLAQKTRKVEFRTLCIERSQDVEKVVIPPSSKKGDGIEVPLFTDISPVISGVFKGDEAVFYSEKAGAGGKTERVIAGKASMGKSNRQLFVFAPRVAGEEGTVYQVMAFEDDEKSFPMGTIRAINLGSVAVRYTLAEELLPEIAAGSSSKFSASEKANSYNVYPVEVEYLDADGDWKESVSSNWKATDRRREIAVTTFDAEAKNLSLKLFSDFPPWLEK